MGLDDRAVGGNSKNLYELNKDILDKLKQKKKKRFPQPCY